MANITIKKGLDIPIAGKPDPHGSIQQLHAAGEASPTTHHRQIALDLSPFDDVKFKILVKVDDIVKIGQPLAEDKESPGRFFVSPAGGRVSEIRRGLKRRLLDIVIDVADKEEIETFPIKNPKDLSKEELLDTLKKGGLFAFIRQRPFNTLANLSKQPKSIFVKALESAPFAPPAEFQVVGREKEFQVGLDALTKLTSGKVYLIYRENSACQAFVAAQNVEKITAAGPHPISNPSIHINALDPIDHAEEAVWTLNAHDVLKIGHFLRTGTYLTERVIAIGGPAIIEGRTGFFKIREGLPITSIIPGRIEKGAVRLISGDVLTGKKVEVGDFLGLYDYAFCAVPESFKREFLHFFRLGLNKYSFTGTYLSGHLNNEDRTYNFTTSQHGETRAFVDGHIYDEVMPLNISTINLVKAVMAEDFDLASFLGLLEVDSEDFALSTFVDPSKIDMVAIIKQGLRRYATDVLK